MLKSFLSVYCEIELKKKTILYVFVIKIESVGFESSQQAPIHSMNA